MEGCPNLGAIDVGVNEIWPEILKALDMVMVLLSICLAKTSGAVPLD